MTNKISSLYQDRQNGRHMRKASMTSSVSFRSRSNDSTIWSASSNHLKRKQGTTQRTVKNNYSLLDTKDNATQGHFHLESILFSSTISIQTLTLSRYVPILISLQIHLILYPGHLIKTEIRENVNQRPFCRNSRFRPQFQSLQFQKAQTVHF